jgi:hypothetical protein
MKRKGDFIETNEKKRLKNNQQLTKTDIIIINAYNKNTIAVFPF